MSNAALETPSRAAGGRHPTQERSFDDHRREIQHDVQTLASALQEAVEDAHEYIVNEMRHQPYRTLAVAAGIGYVLSGGLGARATRILLGLGTRLALAVAAREVGMRLQASHATGEAL